MAARSKRELALIVLPKDAYTFVREITFTAQQLQSDLLKVDERYQRLEVKDKVRDIIASLEAGNEIPEPIWVSMRPTGEYYIVDGQQRFWACWHSNRGITARIYKVKDWKTESYIFHLLNDRKALAASHRAYTWAGPSGDLLRRVNKDSASPLRHELASSSSARLPASTFAKGLLAALEGTSTNAAWNIKRVMQRMDSIVKQNPNRSWKTAQMFSVVLRQIFQTGKIPSLPPRAIGHECYNHWKGLRTTAAWPTPSAREYRRLRSLHWTSLTPSQEQRYLPVVREQVRQRWAA